MSILLWWLPSSPRSTCLTRLSRRYLCYARRPDHSVERPVLKGNCCSRKLQSRTTTKLAYMDPPVHPRPASPAPSPSSQEETPALAASFVIQSPVIQLEDGECIVIHSPWPTLIVPLNKISKSRGGWGRPKRKAQLNGSSSQLNWSRSRPHQEHRSLSQPSQTARATRAASRPSQSSSQVSTFCPCHTAAR